MNGQAWKLLVTGFQLASEVGSRNFQPNKARARAESRHKSTPMSQHQPDHQERHGDDQDVPGPVAIAQKAAQARRQAIFTKGNRLKVQRCTSKTGETAS